MWDKILVEKDLQYDLHTKKILSKLDSTKVHFIDNYTDIWGKYKKPYLHKRTNLNLFIAKKKGHLVKPAPPAYGINNGVHYYFIHGFNCIYECQYCYLQGYFNTPDLVLFVNHHEIIQEMNEVLNKNPHTDVWFHAGEYSDSLALSHLSQELPLYFEFFKNNPRAFYELRTKSVNIKELRKLSPQNNIVISFSLSPAKHTEVIDLKTPSLKARLAAMKELKSLGYQWAIHLDPVIYDANFISNYQDLVSHLDQEDLLKEVSYISIGVVRFTKKVYQDVKFNYPQSLIHSTLKDKSFDNKIRYSKPLRTWMLQSIKKMLIEKHTPTKNIYFCMEND